MRRIVACPYCNTQQGVELIETKERVDFKHDCIDPKCGKNFLVPLNYKKVLLSRTFAVSDAKYKFAIHVKKDHSGVIIPIDLLDYEGRLNSRLDRIEINEEIVDEVDIVVAYINQPSFGTTFEIARAHTNEIPIYIIDMNRMWANDPWIKHVSTKTFDDIDECFQYVIDKIVSEYNKNVDDVKTFWRNC